MDSTLRYFYMIELIYNEIKDGVELSILQPITGMIEAKSEDEANGKVHRICDALRASTTHRYILVSQLVVRDDGGEINSVEEKIKGLEEGGWI